jgi:mannose-6-phosphate isomerase-like protein (cupin superfamily)
MGATMTINLTGEEAGQTWSLIAYTAPAHFAGPPPHVHDNAQESFVVLEGTLCFVIGDQTTSVSRGTFVCVPPGTVHTFSNPDTTPATYLAWFSPAGTEQACRELAALVAAEPEWPPADGYRLTTFCRERRAAPAHPNPIG